MIGRRSLLCGAAALPIAGMVPALASSLSTNDARLIAIAAELREVYDRTAALGAVHRPVDEHPEWDGLIARFEPLEDEMAAIPADTLAGVLAKARALQIPTCRECAGPEMGCSLADDLARLAGERQL